MDHYCLLNRTDRIKATARILRARTQVGCIGLESDMGFLGYPSINTIDEPYRFVQSGGDARPDQNDS